MKSESVARLAFSVSAFGVGVDEVDLVDGVDLVQVKGERWAAGGRWIDADEDGCLA